MPFSRRWHLATCPHLQAMTTGTQTVKYHFRSRYSVLPHQRSHCRRTGFRGPGADQAGHAWKRRTAALIELNPRSVTETSPQALFQATAYPDAVAAACASHKSLQ